MAAPIDASRLAGRLAMALRRVGARAAGSTGASAVAASGTRTGDADGAGGGDRKGRSVGPDAIEHARRAETAHAQSAEWVRPAERARPAECAQRAGRSERVAGPSSLVALLRARLASIDGDPAAHRRRATRLIVEALLGREFAPRLQADPRYPGWIDDVVEALETEPTWRIELDALMEVLGPPGPAAAGGSAVASFTGDSTAEGSASGLPNCSTRSA